MQPDNIPNPPSTVHAPKEGPLIQDPAYLKSRIISLLSYACVQNEESHNHVQRKGGAISWRDAVRTCTDHKKRVFGRDRVRAPGDSMV